ncbi:hypothetical protein [Caballeronia sp. dw_19]|uniref:hypothetical protein n=1 Tax=Caballeronia sp. dw_19 TaxID=2719791 RepID=UPI001BD62C05|nr:hypothetical protein [Caballeronia sp. dw_19]
MNAPPRLIVDWARIVEETRRGGYSVAEISQYTTIPKSSLLSYQFNGTEPTHSTGVVLLRFWGTTTKQDANDPPLIRRPLSAASFR